MDDAMFVNSLPTPLRRVFSVAAFVAVALAGLCLSGVAAEDVFPAEKREWRCIVSQHFEVFASDSDIGALRAMVDHFERLHAVFLETFPITERRPMPFTVYVFGHEEDYLRYAQSRSAGVHLLWPDRAVAMIRFNQREKALPILSHEYVHHLFTLSGERRSMWYAEGMAELFSTIEREGDRVLIGRPIDRRVKTVRELPLLPLEELFAVERQSEESKSAHFYAQSWALMHFLNFGASGLPREQVAQFLSVARDPKHIHSPLTIRQACKEYLRIDYPELESRLKTYVEGGSYQVVKVPAPKLPDPQTYAVRAVPRAEIHLRLAELSLRLKRPNSARAVLKEMAARDTRESRVYEALAADAHVRGQADTARLHWEKAVELGSNNPAVYRALLFDQARALFSEVHLDFRMDVTMTKKMRQLINRSLSFGTNQDVPYDALAWVEAFAAEPSIENVKLAQDHFACSLLKPRMLLALALVRERFGESESALKLLSEMETYGLPRSVREQVKNVRRWIASKKSTDIRFVEDLPDPVALPEKETTETADDAATKNADAANKNANAVDKNADAADMDADAARKERMPEGRGWKTEDGRGMIDDGVRTPDG